MRARLIVLVLVLGATPAAAQSFAGRARIGVSQFLMDDPLADSSPSGKGLVLGAELALVFEKYGIEPSLALEVAQFTGISDNGFNRTVEIRSRPVSAMLRTRIAITPNVYVLAGAGASVTFERSSSADHFYGWRYEGGLGVRVWHDDRHAVSVDLVYATATYNVPGQGGVEFGIGQLGVGVAYSLRL